MSAPIISIREVNVNPENSTQTEGNVTNSWAPGVVKAGEESKEKVALRLWNGPMTSDTIARSGGEPFTLYNIPIYYAGHLHVFLQRKIGGMAFG